MGDTFPSSIKFAFRYRESSSSLDSLSIPRYFRAYGWTEALHFPRFAPRSLAIFIVLLLLKFQSFLVVSKGVFSLQINKHFMGKLTDSFTIQHALQVLAAPPFSTGMDHHFGAKFE